MNNELTSRKKLPFVAEKDSAAFQHEIILALIKDVDARTKDIPASNIYMFQHGRKWDFQQRSKEGFRPQSGELELTRSTTTIELPRVLANDAALIPEFIQKMSVAIERTASKKPNHGDGFCRRAIREHYP